VRQEAVAGRGLSSGEPSRPPPELDLRGAAFRCFVAGAWAVDWPERVVRAGRGRGFEAGWVRGSVRPAGRFGRAAGLGARSSRGRSSRETRRGGSGARRCGISQ
jgi:hypothetical protein